MFIYSVYTIFSLASVAHCGCTVCDCVLYIHICMHGRTVCLVHLCLYVYMCIVCMCAFMYVCAHCMYASVLCVYVCYVHLCMHVLICEYMHVCVRERLIYFNILM